MVMSWQFGCNYDGYRKSDERKLARAKKILGNLAVGKTDRDPRQLYCEFMQCLAA